MVVVVIVAAAVVVVYRISDLNLFDYWRHTNARTCCTTTTMMAAAVARIKHLLLLVM